MFWQIFFVVVSVGLLQFILHYWNPHSWSLSPLVSHLSHHLSCYTALSFCCFNRFADSKDLLSLHNVFPAYSHVMTEPLARHRPHSRKKKVKCYLVSHACTCSLHVISGLLAGMLLFLLCSRLGVAIFVMFVFSCLCFYCHTNTSDDTRISRLFITEVT